jgi:hypothetical protein
MFFGSYVRLWQAQDASSLPVKISAADIKKSLARQQLFIRENALTRKSSAERSGGIALRNLQRDAAHLFVDQGVGGEDHRAAERIRLARKIADFAAGFFDEQHAGGGVPFVQAKFPEAIKAARGHASEIQSGRAVAAHAVRAQRKIPVVVNIGIGQALVNGKTGAEQTRRKRFDFRDADFFPVECGASAARGGIKLVVNRIVDDAGENLVFLRQSDGNAKARIAMSKIRGAIERIDVPAKFGSVFLTCAFLRGDGVVRKIFRESRDDGLLGSLIGLRDEVNVAFVSNLRGAVEFFVQDFSGFLGYFDCRIEIVIWHAGLYAAELRTARILLGSRFGRNAVNKPMTGRNAQTR